MNLLSYFLKKCSVMQWGIGIARGDISEMIRNKKLDLQFTWLEQKNTLHFIADPFIIVNSDGELQILHEDFSIAENGFISVKMLDQQLKEIAQKQLLKQNNHLSYPFIFVDEDKTYLIPESSSNGELAAYEYDITNTVLHNKKVLLTLPLLDASFLKYNNKYWVFASLADGVFDDSKLYIYYADSFTGEYTAHPKNPVKENLNGSRPAGNFIAVDGDLYRPAQNSSEYYGKSITINKILRLTEDEFEEECYFEIDASQQSYFNAGVHTINSSGGMVVIDGVKLLFMPLTKTRLFIKDTFKKWKN